MTLHQYRVTVGYWEDGIVTHRRLTRYEIVTAFTAEDALVQLRTRMAARQTSVTVFDFDSIDDIEPIPDES